MSTIKVDRFENTAGVAYGMVVQTVNFQTGAYTSVTNNIPVDDTIPQITEGTEVMTCAITPKSATNKLKITVGVSFTPSAAFQASAALFQDSTADALAATSSTTVGATYTGCFLFVYYMTAGTTSSTTFRVRIGGTGGNALYFNGYAGARVFGGVSSSSITIEEIQV